MRPSDPVISGSDLTYTAVLKNNGPDDPGREELQAYFPMNSVTIVSAAISPSSPSANCTIYAVSVDCDIFGLPMPSGSSTTVTEAPEWLQLARPAGRFTSTAWKTK